MRARMRVRPSKPVSVMAMLVGLGMTAVGIFVVIPHFGIFGIVWTLVAVAITVMHAVNVFSGRGVAHEVMEFDMTGPDSIASEAGGVGDAEQRLETLERLKRKGLVGEEEYQQQRRKILAEL